MTPALICQSRPVTALPSFNPAGIDDGLKRHAFRNIPAILLTLCRTVLSDPCGLANLRRPDFSFRHIAPHHDHQRHQCRADEQSYQSEYLYATKDAEKNP
jgi:hypothetical protein